MDDQLKAAVDRARAAGMTGLVCGVCDESHKFGVTIVDEHGDRMRLRFACPACDGTGYPSAAEVTFWILTSGGVRHGALLRVLRCAFPMVGGGCAQVDVGEALRLALDAAGAP